MLKISLQWVFIAWQGIAQTPQPLCPLVSACFSVTSSFLLTRSVNQHSVPAPPIPPSPWKCSSSHLKCPPPPTFLPGEFLFYFSMTHLSKILSSVKSFCLFSTQKATVPSSVFPKHWLLLLPSCSGLRFSTGHPNSPHHLVCWPRLENLTPSLLPQLKPFFRVTSDSLTSSNSNEYPVLLFSEAFTGHPFLRSEPLFGLWLPWHLTLLECSPLNFSFLTTVTVSSLNSHWNALCLGPGILTWRSSTSEERP